MASKLTSRALSSSSSSSSESGHLTQNPVANAGDPSPVLSVVDIIKVVYSLDPLRALNYTNGDRRRLCVTPVYDAVEMDGIVHRLRRGRNLKTRLEEPDRWIEDGSCFIIYVRVSSEAQHNGSFELDGRSVDEQVQNGIRTAVERGQAFAVYTDHGLSGGLPHDDPALIAALAKKRAQYYREAFTNVFLSGRFKTKEAALRAYMNAKIEDDLRQFTVEGLARSATVFSLDKSGRRLGEATFRPALSIALDDLRAGTAHSIGATDQDRLARSLYLILVIVQIIQAADARVVGTLSDLEHVNMTTTPDEFRTTFDGLIAQSTLRQVRLRALSGGAGMLAAGRVAGVPFWLEKTPRSQLPRERKDIPAYRVRRPVASGAESQTISDTPPRIKTTVRGFALVRYICWLRWSRQWGVEKIAKRLRHYGIPGPREEQVRRDGKPSGSWSGPGISKILRNPALIGDYLHYGVRWEGQVPQAISQATWEAVQVANLVRSEQGKFGNSPVAALLVGLIRCPFCAGTLKYVPTTRGSKPFYCCVESRRAARRRDVPAHNITINVRDIEPVIDFIFRHHSHVIVDKYKQSKQYDEAKAETERTRVAHELAEKERALATALADENAPDEARKMAEAIGQEVDEDFLIFARKKLVKDAASRAERANAEFEEAKSRLSRLAAARMDNIEEACADWEFSSVAQRNGLLRALIREIKYEVIWASTGDAKSVHLISGNDENAENALVPVSTGGRVRATLSIVLKALDAVPVEPIRVYGRIDTTGRVMLWCEDPEAWALRALDLGPHEWVDPPIPARSAPNKP